MSANKNATRLKQRAAAAKKLEQADANFIRKQKGTMSAATIAFIYEISPRMVYKIWAGKVWAPIGATS